MCSLLVTRTTRPSSSSSSPSHLLLTGFLGIGAEEVGFGTSSSDASALLAMLSYAAGTQDAWKRTPVRHCVSGTASQREVRVAMKRELDAGRSIISVQSGRFAQMTRQSPEPDFGAYVVRNAGHVTCTYACSPRAQPRRGRACGSAPAFRRQCAPSALPCAGPCPGRIARRHSLCAACTPTPRSTTRSRI